MLNKGATKRFKLERLRQKIRKKTPIAGLTTRRKALIRSEVYLPKIEPGPFVFYRAADGLGLNLAIDGAVEHKIAAAAIPERTPCSHQIHYRLNKSDQFGMSQNPLKSKRDLCYQVSQCKVNSL